MRNDNKKFRGLEIAMDNIRIEEHLLPQGATLDGFSFRNVGFFRNYGFKVSEVFSQLYEKANGIASEKYIPASIYFYYISPYLMNMNMTMAYVDKNAYELLFPDVHQPETIVHNINGKFCNSLRGGCLRISDVMQTLSRQDRFIIKPAIESGRGRDVTMIENGVSDSELSSVLDYFGSDYIIQKVVRQHKDLALLNSTSLNTCRVYTYRPIGSGDIVVLGAAVRFGGEGAYRDNACKGGGFCRINEDGTINDRIHQYRFWGTRSLSQEKGVQNLKFPSYEKVIELVKTQHSRLYYMDLVGWDIAVDENGEPVLIELNQYPDCEFIQIFNGPMFGEYTNEIMEAVSEYDTKFVTVAKRSFSGLSAHHDYNFEIGRKYSI